MKGPKTGLHLYLHCKSYHPYYLNKTLKLLQQELLNWNISNYKVVFLPKQVERFTVLRSPHVDKKARDQFERITHKRLLVIALPTMEMGVLQRVLNFVSSAAIGVEVGVRYVVV